MVIIGKAVASVVLSFSFFSSVFNCPVNWYFSYWSPGGAVIGRTASVMKLIGKAFTRSNWQYLLEKGKWMWSALIACVSWQREEKEDEVCTDLLPVDSQSVWCVCVCVLAHWQIEISHVHWQGRTHTHSSFLCLPLTATALVYPQSGT